jgi:hypothetical protein
MWPESEMYLMLLPTVSLVGCIIGKSQRGTLTLQVEQEQLEQLPLQQLQEQGDILVDRKVKVVRNSQSGLVTDVGGFDACL